MLHRVHCAAVAGTHADPEQRLTRLGHDRPHVGEVQVDEAGQRDQVENALHALAQHVVDHAERLDHRGRLVEHGREPGEFGITIMSTSRDSSSTPRSACSPRRAPSNENSW